MSDKKTEKKPLVPRLRFPEFQNAGEWEVKQLGEHFSFAGTNCLSREKLNYTEGTVKNIHYGDIHTKFSALFNIKNAIVPYINSSELPETIPSQNYCCEGDIIFADASETMDDIGKCIELIKLDGERVLSGLHTILARPKTNNFSRGFCGSLFQSLSIRTQIKKEAQGAKVLGLSANRLAKIVIYFPQKELEQQKIADCLSSLDELTTSECKKLDSLKAHKKGLMQQLFPREGETTPRQRFKIFAPDGSWQIQSIKDRADIFASGDLDTKSFSKNKSATHPYPVFSNAIEKEGLFGFYTTAKYAEQSITITARGTLGVAFLRNEKFMGIGRLLVLTNFQSTNPYFLKECWNFLAIIPNEVTSIPQLTSISIKKIKLPFPLLPEQQKIADCLSSLDELIAAQSRKIELLKLQKKGLMQQLFPEMNEVAE